MMRQTLSLILAFTCLACAVAQGGWSPSSCNIPGFELKQKQLPAQRYGILPPGSATSLLNTIRPPGQAPKPLPDLGAAAAACRADASCIMFTSDGFLIGAYRRVDPDKTEAVKQAAAAEDRAGGPFTWTPMGYCPGTCCGTWVAKDALNPVNNGLIDTRSSAGSKNSGASDAPRDFTEFLSGSVPVSTVRRVCTSAPASSPTRPATTTAGSQQCPQRCLVACCKQATGLPDSGSIKLEAPYFAQCSNQWCNTKACGFMSTGGVGAAVSNVLLYQYRRAASQGAAPGAGAGGAGTAQPRTDCGRGLC